MKGGGHRPSFFCGLEKTDSKTVVGPGIPTRSKPLASKDNHYFETNKLIHDHICSLS